MASFYFCWAQRRTSPCGTVFEKYFPAGPIKEAFGRRPARAVSLPSGVLMEWRPPTDRAGEQVMAGSCFAADCRVRSGGFWSPPVGLDGSGRASWVP